MNRAVDAAAVLVLLLLGLLLLAGPAHAACDVTATGISFGAYDVFAAPPLVSTGSVTVSCDEVPPPDVVVAIGPGSSGSFQPRQLRHASRPDRLNYNLFTTASMTAVWGDGTAGTSTVFLRNVRRNRPPVVTTIHGRIPAGQDVAVGAYSDTLTVTITW